jgi:predicted regulator of Ras-like GTPase activity (Roadblock/LC7/MglB family)
MLFETLRKIVEETPGATGAILMGFDGIAVMQYLAKGHERVDIESLAMEFSFRFIELTKAARALELGEVSDITVKAQAGTILCRVLSDEYFAAVVLHDASHFGKGRWLLRANAEHLVTEL